MFHSLALMLRGRAGLTQRELAAAIGVSERAVQVWESGLGYPSAASLQRVIALYLEHAAFGPGRETEEAAALWAAAAGEAPRFKHSFDFHWFAELLASTTRSARTNSHSLHDHIYDWGEAPDLRLFHGRGAEQHLLEQWLLRDRCRVVSIVGMGGIGKTALAAKVATDFAPSFDALVWRSLRNAEPCTDWLAETILYISGHRAVPGETEKARKRQLLELLRLRRCLLVLDNLETILEPHSAELRFREEHAGYGRLLRALVETPHSSCLMVTSRELTSELADGTGPVGPVRVLRLGGLDNSAGQALLADKGLVGTAHMWGTLVRRYDGSPLALQVVGESIAALFNGDIASFLKTGEAVFGDIRRLLDSQIGRLSSAERTVLFALALSRESVMFDGLVAYLGLRVERYEILDALQTLHRRSLLEIGEREATYTLQPVVLEHVTQNILAALVDEITARQPSLLVTHALVNVHGTEYMRRSQERLVAQPLLDRLEASLTTAAIDASLLMLLELWRGRPAAEQGFGPGNVVNLLRLRRGNLRGLDLSHLVLRQVDFAHADAQDLQLAHSTLVDVHTGNQVGAALSTDLSGDGSCWAVGTVAGEVRVWDMQNRTPVLLNRQPDGPWQIALSGDGRVLASSGAADGIFIWSYNSSRPLRVLKADAQDVYCVALSVDGRIAAGGSADSVARVWNTETGECLQTVQCHWNTIRGIALSGDARVLAAGGPDGQVGVWDVSAEPRLMHMWQYSGEGRAVVLSRDGRIVAYGDADGVAHVREVDSGACLAELHGHAGSIWTASLNANGRLLATGGVDRTLRIWDTRTGDCRRVLHEHSAGIMSAALSGDGHFAASVCLDGTARMWELGRGRCVAATQGQVASAYEVALSADGRLAVGGGGDGSVRIWDISSGSCTRVLPGHSAAVWATALSADGQVAVSGGLDSTIRVWHVPTGECRALLIGNNQGISSVALSSDQRLVASGCFDGTLRLWDAASGECLAVRQCDSAGVRSVRFSRQGHVLVTGEVNGTLRVWDPETAECVRRLNSQGEGVQALALSGDGRLVAWAEPGGCLRWWDTRDGDNTVVVETGAPGFHSLTMTSDGATLIGGADDGAVQVWDVATRALRYSVQAHSGEIWGLALTENGHFGLSAGLDGTIVLWDVAHQGEALRTMRPDRPYERMDLTGVNGLTGAQLQSMFALGAISAS